MRATRLIISYVSFLLLTACQNGNDTPVPTDTKNQVTPKLEFTPAQGHVNSFVKITGAGFGNKRENLTVQFNTVTAIIKEFTDSTIITAVPVNATSGKVSVKIDDQTITSATDFTVVPKDSTLFTGTWVRKADFPGDKRSGAVTFANAAGGFISLGGLGDYTLKDTWQYQPVTDQWVPRPDFPGLQRMGGASFTIGQKAYIVTGFAYFSPGKINDFWEFDTETFAWTRKADFPGQPRKYAAAFAVHNKGYLTTGIIDYGEPELKDMWEYDPATDKWQQKANIPFSSRSGAASFSIGDKAYAGFGTHLNGGSEEGQNDFWEYEPTTDKWTRKADFPEYLTNTYAAFVLNQSGYLITGNRACWQYNPAADKWIERKAVPEATAGAASFVAGSKAYVVMPYAQRLYQFEP